MQRSADLKIIYQSRERHSQARMLPIRRARSPQTFHKIKTFSNRQGSQWFDGHIRMISNLRSIHAMYEALCLLIEKESHKIGQYNCTIYANGNFDQFNVQHLTRSVLMRNSNLWKSPSFQPACVATAVCRAQSNWVLIIWDRDGRIV